MPWKNRFAAVVVLILSGFALVAAGKGAEILRDLWIHPRGAVYDPALHYKAPDGELFFHAENDLGKGLEEIVIHAGSDPRVSAELGADLWRFLEKHGGSLAPVVLYDSNGDGSVDRTLRGAIENQSAVFTSPEVAGIDWQGRHWQMGIRYQAGANGSQSDDRRYLASVDGKDARVRFPRVDDLPAVSAEPVPDAGLVIFEHREGQPFDLVQMARQPGSYISDFEELTPAPDADDWTVEKKSRGRLRTHLDEEELFLVRTRGNATLAIEWGDMPLEQYMREHLGVTPDADGCLSTMESQVVGDDGVHAPVPHRILFCPQSSMAVFDAPAGYEIGLTAVQGEQSLERTEASTSILDNLRLYGRQVYPRSPNTRATGTLAGNLKASYRDSGQDLLDMGRHLVTGTTRENIHTGQLEKQTSLLAAVPMFLIGVAKLDPVQGGKDFVEGIQSGVQVAADAVSATNNAVINPLLQTTVGLASLEAADDAGHVTGAVTQAWAKNLPGSERSMDALNPMSLWYHDRAFKPTAYTRTDTQLNIDRLISIANILASTGSPPSEAGAAVGAGEAAVGASPLPRARRPW